MSSNVFGQAFGGSLLESSNNAFGTEFGSAASNAFGIRPFEDNFPSNIFSPTDLTGCLVWFDAADETTVGAASPGNEIIKWDNKGTAGGYLEADGLTSVFTKTHKVNDLNSIYFPEYSTLIMNGLTIDQLARTIFVVSKGLTDMTTSPQPYTGFFNTNFTAQSLNCGNFYDVGSDAFGYAICENGIRCGVVAAVGLNPVNETQIMCWGQTDQDPPTGNVFTLNGTSISPLNESWPAQFYPLAPDNYIVNSPSYGTAQDMCEIIIYNRLLNPIERILVQLYLLAKWTPPK